MIQLTKNELIHCFVLFSFVLIVIFVFFHAKQFI